MVKPTRLSDLLTRFDATTDRDHERISKVLHDETGSLMTAAALQLELLRMDGVEGLQPALDALEQAFDSLRNLSRNVHPRIVERIGLPAALTTLVNSRKSHFTGTFQTNIDINAVGHVAMYRIAEELIDNAIRHSNARTIELLLTRAGALIVRDDGQGFDTKEVTTGVGLLRVRYWGKKASLRVRLRTTPELGTMFRVDPPPCHLTSF